MAPTPKDAPADLEQIRERHAGYSGNITFNLSAATLLQHYARDVGLLLAEVDRLRKGDTTLSRYDLG